jgi:dTDP-4-dehydrorhamnose reductase
VASQRLSFAVIGSTGMLGTALVYYLRHRGHYVHEYVRPAFDIVRDSAAQIDLHELDCVVNASGVINRRIAAGTADSVVRRVNTEFPHELAFHCARNQVPLIHISTDCVFDGIRGGNHEETPVSAHDDYGRSKAEGEPASCLVLRSSIVGPERQNHYSVLCWFLAQQGVCPGFVNHQWNGVTSLELARVIECIVSQGWYRIGLRHIYGEDTTKHELLRLFAEAYRVPTQIIPVEAEVARDTRLRTCFTDDLRRLGIRPLREQIAELPLLSTSDGSWSNLRELQPAERITVG